MRYISMIVLLFFISCKNKKQEHKDPDTYYTCSMDPQVVEYKPGKCPICHRTDIDFVQRSLRVAGGIGRDRGELGDTGRSARFWVFGGNW